MRQSSVARQILLLQLLIFAVVVAAAAGLAFLDARRGQLEDARIRSVDIARAVADSPTVHEALRVDDPSLVIQPYAEAVRRDTGTDFVVVMGLDRTRYSHPDPAQIGRPFIGDLGGAPAGGVFAQEYTGTLGPSMRAVVPVTADDGDVVALVSVGITLERISDALRGRLAQIAVVAVGLLAVGAGGAWLISRRLRRQTHGLGEREITRMYEYYDAVLHAVREGLILLDLDLRVQLANDEGLRLLELDETTVGRPVQAVGLPDPLVAAMTGATTGGDQIHLVGDRVLVVNRAEAAWQGRVVGSVVTLRDHTELRAISGELDSVRGLAESLRSQTHEAANRLHTVVSLIELGRPDDAVEFATGELAAAQSLADRIHGTDAEPVVAALLLGKSAQAAERGIALVIDPSSSARGLPFGHQDLVTVLGNLVDNAFDAIADSQTKTVEVRLRSDASTLELDVDDSGPGLAAADSDRAFERGWTTKAGEPGIRRGIGLALVAQVVRRHGGTVAAGRSALGGASFRVRIGAR